MICPTCIHYLPVSQKQPIAPVCDWAPSEEQIAHLRDLIPAPALSRALVQAAPHQVEACGAFVTTEEPANG